MRSTNSTTFDENSSSSDGTETESLPSTSAASVFPRRNRRYASSAVDSISEKSKLIKATRSWRERRQTMETMGKLKQLVPTVPKDERVSKIELLQHVIDYIFELQRQLNDPLTMTEDREL